jgi:glycosyltransferase involved in cell wall biosynthesis/2-polyprenyl-3-methyl-5-hydroxy-6-metoxy-1,4-benzoquinol methylase
MASATPNSRDWWEQYFETTWEENGGPAQTRYFMELLLATLPALEREYLHTHELDILDWGCAFGDGVETLAQAFPRCRVTGLDFSERAVREARGRYPDREFLHDVRGEIARPFDVIVSSNCLEHFDCPLTLLRSHLASCRTLLIVQVPYNEHPLHEYHRSQFREESFPTHVFGFSRLCCRRVDADPRYWNGQQLVVAYGSASYVRQRLLRGGGDAEREKWDDYYRSVLPGDIPDEIQDFTVEFADRIDALLPPGASLLEAGCGEGSQSLELARRGSHRVTLMDFSPEALRHAAAAFERAGLPATLTCDDIATPGLPHFDLVFNLGVLEHYTFEEQVELLRGMASRSRRYVLVVVPNRLCYWYWVWRTHVAAGRKWPYGTETPAVCLSRLFEAAGMRFLGQAFVGDRWAESFIANCAGIDEGLRQQILAIHRSPLIPSFEKSYLTAALGSVAPADTQPPAGWKHPPFAEDHATAAAYAALADALALRVAADADIGRLEAREADLRREFEEQKHLLEEVRARADARDREVGALRGHAAEKQSANETLRRRLAEAVRDFHEARAERDQACAERDEQRRTVRTLRSDLSESERALGEAARHHAEEQRAAEEARARLAEEQASFRKIRAERAETAEHLAATHDALEKLRQELAAKEEEAHALYAQLVGIYNSTGWAMLKPVYWLRHRLAPAGSRRERFGRACMHLLRRLRFRARQAPAFFRARFRRTNPVPAAVAPIPPPSPAPAVRGTNEMPGLVSVVLPVYNQVDVLRESIQSVLAQTYPHIELIVVNDGSTDGVEAVLDEYAADPRVRLLAQSNQTLPKALSNGFALAGGEFWTWTSADNIMEPACVATLVAFLQRKPDVAMVYADYLAIDDAGHPLRDPTFRPHNRRSPGDPEIHLPRTTEQLNTVQDNFIGPCFLYRSWAGRLLGEYGPYLGVEDYDYWMRMNGLFRIEHLGTDQILYQYRVHQNTLNARAEELKILERVQALMARERERRAFFDRPWQVQADAASRDWLRTVETGSHTVGELANVTAPDGGLDKTLVVIHADTLPLLARSARPPGACAAVWFGSDAAAPFEHRAEIRRSADVCFAPDARAAERLALFTDAVFEVPSSQRRFDLAVAYANNRAFYEATNEASARRREPPRAYVPAARKLHVLLQVDDFTQGGMEQVVLRLAACLEQEGATVSLLILGRKGPAAAQARAAGIRVVELPEARREEHYRRLLETEGVDLVNAHYSLFGAALARERCTPFVQTIHNSYVWLSPDQTAAYQTSAPHTTAYVCVSSNVAFYSDVRMGLPPEKMVVIPNGVDAGRFEPRRAPAREDGLREKLGLAPDDFVFLNVASVHAPKAQLTTVRALAAVAGHCPGARAVFLGPTLDPAYLARVKQEVAARGLEASVRFVNHHEEVAPFYRMADAFVLPSFWEGWSLALGEALCAGLPIIASDVGGARDLADLGTIRLLRPAYGSIVALDCATIARCLRDEQAEFVAALADAMASIYREPVEPGSTDAVRRRLDWRHVYTAYARLFELLVQGGSPARARRWLRAQEF